MKVKDIMDHKREAGVLFGVGKDATVAEAVKVMVERDAGSCLVLEDGNLRGLVTFREVLIRLAQEPAACMDGPVAGVMDADPVVVTLDDTVDQIRGLMTSKHIRYLPVMNDGTLVAVISLHDIARAVATNVAFENRMLKQYIADWPEDQG